MGFSVVSEKSGATYYLHSKDVPLKNTGRVQTIYFFSKNPEGSIDLPAGREVIQNKRSGLPFLKKKA